MTLCIDYIMGKLIHQTGFKLNRQDCLSANNLDKHLNIIREAGCKCIQLHLNIINQHPEKKRLMSVLKKSGLRLILHMPSLDDVFYLYSILDESISNAAHECVVHLPRNEELTTTYIHSAINQFNKFGLRVFFENELGCTRQPKDWHKHMELDDFHVCLDVAHDYLSTGILATDPKVITRSNIIHIHGADPILRNDHLCPWSAPWNPIAELHKLWTGLNNSTIIFEIKNLNNETIDKCVSKFLLDIKKHNEPYI